MSWWILIADASRAFVYSTAGRDKPLRLERELENPKGRKRTQQLVSDEPGRAFKGNAPGTRSAMQPRTSAHEAAAEQFAAKLATMLREACLQKKYDSLAIVAPAHLLGQLRAHLKGMDHVLRGSLAGDLVHVPAPELAPHLASVFGP